MADDPDMPDDDDDELPASEVPDAGWPEFADGAGWPGAEVSSYGDDDLVTDRPALGEYGRARTAREDALDERQLRELERRMESQRTPAFPLDTRRSVPMKFLWRRWQKLAMAGRSDIVDDFGRDPRATARWEPLLEVLYSRWFRVETRGLDNVPSRGPALLVANHAGTLPYDSAMIVHAIRRDHPARRDVRPLVEDAVFHLPYLGPLINRIGGVRADPENAERLLTRGELVAVFPEGVKGMGKLWRERYRLQRFGRGGFVKLALRTGAPIIPVAVVGAEEALPMLGKVTWFAKSIGLPYVPVTPLFPWLGPLGLVPLPSKWHLRFGEPIELGKEYTAEAADDRLLVNRLADAIRGQIQQMVDDTLADRQGVFR